VCGLEAPGCGSWRIAAICVLAGLNFEPRAERIKYVIGSSMQRRTPIASHCVPSTPSADIRQRLSTFIADRKAREMPRTRMAEQDGQRILSTTRGGQLACPRRLHLNLKTKRTPAARLSPTWCLVESLNPDWVVTSLGSTNQMRFRVFTRDGVQVWKPLTRTRQR